MITYKDKKTLVLHDLSEKNEIGRSVFEIQERLKDKVPKTEVEIILQHLFEKSLVLKNWATEVSGAVIPIPLYKLSFDGFSLLEGTIKVDANSKVEDIVADIDKCLAALRWEFQTEENYSLAKGVLLNYFLGLSYELAKPLFVKHRVKKKFASALGELFVMQKNKPVNFEYLDLVRKTFSLFEDENVDSNSVFTSNLYKYCMDKKKY
jgi:hypothetical protein